MCARTFLVVCQMAGPMGTNLGTWIHLDLGSVLVKSRSRGWRRHRHREGVVEQMPQAQEWRRCMCQFNPSRGWLLWLVMHKIVIIVIHIRHFLGMFNAALWH